MFDTRPTRDGIVALIYDLKAAAREQGARPCAEAADAERTAARALLAYVAAACPEFTDADARKVAA